jgi:uncharacterized membrane-anchored protein
MADYSYQSLAANMSPQGRWRRVLLIAMIPMALVLLYFSYPSSYIPSSLKTTYVPLPCPLFLTLD